MRQLQIYGPSGGNYVIHDMSGQEPTTSVASGGELREYLRKRGATDPEIAQSIKDLRLKHQALLNL